jgi:hypothetical protein
LKMVPRFTIVTDHKNLRYFRKAQHLNERQMRWADILTEFNYKLKYRPRKLAARPNALSRRSQDTPQHITDERLSNRFRTLLKKVQIKTGRPDLPAVEGVDFEKEIPLFEEPTLQQEWKNARSTDPEYQKICEALAKGDRRIAAETNVKTSLSEYHLDERGLLCFRQRIWIPDSETLRTGIIQKIHDSHIIAHPGRDATYAILSRRFF